MDSRLGLKEGGALHPLRPDQIPFPTTSNIPDQTPFFSDRPTAKGLGGGATFPPSSPQSTRQISIANIDSQTHDSGFPAFGIRNSDRGRRRLFKRRESSTWCVNPSRFKSPPMLCAQTVEQNSAHALTLKTALDRSPGIVERAKWWGGARAQKSNRIGITFTKYTLIHKWFCMHWDVFRFITHKLLSATNIFKGKFFSPQFSAKLELYSPILLLFFFHLPRDRDNRNRRRRGSLKFEKSPPFSPSFLSPSSS